MKDGLVRLLKKDSLTHGIQVTISDNNEITLNFHVIVAYGVNILSVSDNLMSNVKYKVEEFTGMAVEKINIFVEGVRVIAVSYTHLDVYKRQVGYYFPVLLIAGLLTGMLIGMISAEVLKRTKNLRLKE